MKCPYRKVTIDLKSMSLDGIEEGFAECYKEECPFYVPENHSYTNIVVPEYCKRTDIDYFNGGNKQ